MPHNYNFIEKTLWHRSFLLNFVKSLRTVFASDFIKTHQCNYSSNFFKLPTSQLYCETCVLNVHAALAGVSVDKFSIDVWINFGSKKGWNKEMRRRVWFSFQRAQFVP